MTRPLVSVIIPTFNSARWIGETIQSVLAQTYRPIEIILGDNGSTDRTLEIAESFGDPVSVARATVRGPGAARNAGLDAARGEFVQFLDSDDLLEPWKIERQMATLQRTGADFVWGPFWMYEEMPNGEFVRTRRRVPSLGSDIALDLFSSEGWLQIGCVLQRQTPAVSALRFIPSLHLEEIDYHVRAALMGARFAPGDGDSGLLFRQHLEPRVSNGPATRIAAGVARNARMMFDWWSARNELTAVRREALSRGLIYAARTMASSAPSQFDGIVAELRAIDPDFERLLPRKLRSLSRLIGYERAERAAAAMHRVRRVACAAVRAAPADEEGRVATVPPDPAPALSPKDPERRQGVPP